MDRTSLLLARLDEIATALACSGHGVALLALGSVGLELDRLDQYSDLDFFAVVEPGSKQHFLDDLGWLTSLGPVAYSFRNTKDGHKLLFDDGVFCEFAVFEPDELTAVAFTPGRVVWARSGVDPAFLRPRTAPPPTVPDVDWQLGEALTNLYVGLGRFWRGEKLSAARIVQGFAVDRVLDLAAGLEPAAPGHRDPFASDRRVEQRLPALAEHLAQFVQGYDRTPESARAIVAFLDAHFAVDPTMKTVILELCEPATGR